MYSFCMEYCEWYKTIYINKGLPSFVGDTANA